MPSMHLVPIGAEQVVWPEHSNNTWALLLKAHMLQTCRVGCTRGWRLLVLPDIVGSLSLYPSRK